MENRGNTFLVIGGTGFIGERVVERLARDEKNRVLVAHVSPLQGTTSSSALYFRANPAAHPEHLKSLVGESNTILVLSQPDAEVVKSLLGVLPRGSGKTILYTSTSLLYRGGPKPQREDDPLEPITQYEKNKLAEEKLLEELCAADSSARVVITRLGNVYGAPKNRGIIGKAFDSLFKGGSITLAGGGKNIRDYTFVDDIADALSQLATRRSRVSFEIVNITTGVGHSLRDVVEKIGETAGKKLEWQEGPAVEETESIIGHSGKLARLIQWSPRDLSEGLHKALERYEAHYR